MRDPLTLQLVAVREQARALEMLAGAAISGPTLRRLAKQHALAIGSGLEAILAVVADTREDAPALQCPACKSTEHQAHAGGSYVCGDCGNNYGAEAA